MGRVKEFQIYRDRITNICAPIAVRQKIRPCGCQQGKSHQYRVNFYGGTGSKPGEIMSSYINRGEVLSSGGWKFIWLTDGEGWKSMQNPLRVGVENIDYVINAYLLRKGLLEKIILAP